MCATKEEVQQFPNSPPDGKGQLGDRDLKVCRRVLFELYNRYPESMPFRDCSDLNFAEYREVIKNPIALDVIKERLDAERADQYGSVEEFLRDVRRIFRNCYRFHQPGSEFYGHAKALEEILDRHLEEWLPHLAYDQAPEKPFSITATKAKRNASLQPGPSRKRKKTAAEAPKGRKTRGAAANKRRQKRKVGGGGGATEDVFRFSDSASEGEDVESDESASDSSMSEGEKLEYLEACERSLGDITPKKKDKRSNADEDDSEDDQDFQTGTKKKGGKGKKSSKK